MGNDEQNHDWTRVWAQYPVLQLRGETAWREQRSSTLQSEGSTEGGRMLRKGQSGGTPGRGHCHLFPLEFVVGSQGLVVVLLLQTSGVPGHDFLCSSKKDQSDHLSSCLSPRLDV